MVNPQDPQYVLLYIMTFCFIYIVIRTEGYNAGYRHRTYEYNMMKYDEVLNLFTESDITRNEDMEEFIVENITNIVNLTRSIVRIM